MRKLSLPLLAVLSLTLVGCAGLGIPQPTAPEPSTSYATIDPESVGTESCKVAVGQINEVSKTVAQLQEAMNNGDALQVVGLLGQVQEQFGQLGEGISDDTELQAMIEETKAAAKNVTDKLSSIDSEDPLGSLSQMQSEFEALQSKLQEVAAYCSK